MRGAFLRIHPCILLDVTGYAVLYRNFPGKAPRAFAGKTVSRSSWNCSWEGQAVPGLFHFTLAAAENALRIGLNVLRDGLAI